MTFSDFIKEYETIRTTNHTYRLGQHFINRFIVDSSSPDMQKLWNERDQKMSMFFIGKIVCDYDWDEGNLHELPTSPF